MLWFERQVVTTLTASLDERLRDEIEAYVDETLRGMPEHLRAGMAAESLALGAWRRVVVVEEGPWVDPDALEPFSLEEMVAKYRHRGLSAALGSPTIAFAEGRCVGGSTEINSGLWHRLPPYLADEWRRRYRIEEFSPETLDRYAEGVERELSVSRVPR